MRRLLARHLIILGCFCIMVLQFLLVAEFPSVLSRRISVR